MQVALISETPSTQIIVCVAPGVHSSQIEIGTEASTHTPFSQVFVV
jgi:hypothetical protein